MYHLLRKLLFLLDPEHAHTVTLETLKILEKLKLTKLFFKPVAQPLTVMGLTFANRVGLAAGLDKNGDYIDALAALGFGFIEVGTVTPKPQVGNPKPRLFRLTEQEAIINRMGFNNKGVEYLIERLKRCKYRGILGINIGKNRDTPIERAHEDYLYGFNAALPYASYITINVSSPNTENLRQLQHADLLQNLLHILKKRQTTFFHDHKKYVPLVVKISPDLTPEEIQAMADIFLNEQIDGVIATNTTIQREGVENSPYAKETGGLSGQPLLQRSTDVVKVLHEQLQDKIPIMACGGIMNADDARLKLLAGASLIQIYSGLIYQGPGITGSVLGNIKSFG